MRLLRMVVFLAVPLVFPAMSGCAGDPARDRTDSCRPPATAGQLSQGGPVTPQFRQVTTIRNKTQGVIANEPKVITAAVPNIYADGTRTGLSGLADGKPYRVLDLQDGQNFEVAGVPFQIAIYPDRDEVTVCQLAEASDPGASTPAP
jgi:hypothetical protein